MIKKKMLPHVSNKGKKCIFNFHLIVMYLQIDISGTRGKEKIKLIAMKRRCNFGWHMGNRYGFRWHIRNFLLYAMGF